MTAFNIVRMRVKPGHENDIDFHRGRRLDEMPGMQALTVVRTGERDFCVIGQWKDMDALAAGRPKMIGILDQFRDIPRGPRARPRRHRSGFGETVVEARAKAVSPQPAA